MAGRFALLFFGVFACSTAVIFIRLSAVDAVLLASYRCLVAAAFLACRPSLESSVQPQGRAGSHARC